MHRFGVLLATGLAGVLIAGSLTAQRDGQVATLLASGQADSARVVLGDVGKGAPSGLRYFAGRLSSHDGAAKAHFRSVARTGGDHAADAHYELAESAYADPRGLYITARRTFRTLVEQFPNSGYVPLALYRIGRAYQITAGVSGDTLQAQIDSARTHFREVIRRFPESPVARHARVALVDADLQIGDAESAKQDIDRLPSRPVWEGDKSVYLRARRSADVRATSPGAFWVQVGAFTNRASIDALVNRLTATVPSVRLVESGRMTLVQVGPYPTMEKAERSSIHIARVEALTCKVIRD